MKDKSPPIPRGNLLRIVKLKLNKKKATVSESVAQTVAKDSEKAFLATFCQFLIGMG
jgi:hypothetical protein